MERDGEKEVLVFLCVCSHAAHASHAACIDASWVREAASDAYRPQRIGLSVPEMRAAKFETQTTMRPCMAKRRGARAPIAETTGNHRTKLRVTLPSFVFAKYATPES